jgi:hypothetical protein
MLPPAGAGRSPPAMAHSGIHGRSVRRLDGEEVQARGMEIRRRAKGVVIPMTIEISEDVRVNGQHALRAAR